ncbi:hypothetical protein D9619_012571 [Psilocybe cf. subviscida]|uniref:Uncharacterized protein n=1 Tax=Psilocybe cf. subviscida TaxID=2480587 RepID=A0A8H5B6G2_9AGAR|nr:hypothetical protein D9619_012571 [Psilocybe cf. subviscida]
MYDYASILLDTEPQMGDLVMNLYPDIKNVLSHDSYSRISKPYYVASLSESDIEDDTPAGSLILCNNGGQLHEMDTEADIIIQLTSMAPTWYLGAVSMSGENPDKLRMSLGYSRAACITQGNLKLITYWRGTAAKGELAMKETGIMASDDAWLQMDDGSGRIAISEVKQNYILIVDMAV